MKNLFFLLTLSFSVFVNAEVVMPRPYPSVKNGMVVYPEGNGRKEISKPCPKYNYDCNTDQIQKIRDSVYDEDVRCEQERCPNRLILKGYPYHKSFLACPKETPLMDKNGKCYSCDTENNQIELLENYDNPCPGRKTFKPVNGKTLEPYPNKIKLAPSCSTDNPLLIQEGYYARCIDCNDEFENYPRVISKKDCDVCTNRTYISGWCVNGTKEKPLAVWKTVKNGNVYAKVKENFSCDTDEDIRMNYFEADWCSMVCPNRFRMDKNTYPVAAYCIKKTIPNYIRSFWKKNCFIVILLGIISLFLLPRILRKMFAKKD